MCSADAPETIEDRKCGDTATRQEAGCHAKKQGKIVLIDVVHNADGLQHAQSAEGDQRDAFIALFAPYRDDLRNEEQCVSNQTEAENYGDYLFLFLFH